MMRAEPRAAQLVDTAERLPSMRRDSSGRQTFKNRRSPATRAVMSRVRNKSRKCCQPKRLSTKKSASQEMRAARTITTVRQ